MPFTKVTFSASPPVVQNVTPYVAHDRKKASPVAPLLAFCFGLAVVLVCILVVTPPYASVVHKLCESSCGCAEMPFDFLSSSALSPVVPQNPTSENSLTPPPENGEDIPVMEQQSTAMEDNAGIITVMQSDLSTTDVHDISNGTHYTPDTHSLLSEKPSPLQEIDITNGQPLVLIVHTHGTECYASPDENGNISSSSPSRTNDTSQNVVEVGRVLADTLNAFGICTLHDKTMCDEKSYIHAYENSRKLISSYLSQYPSIRFVFDIHRDALESADSRTACTFASDGIRYAQMMFVVGTDESGADHPRWQENLALALYTQNAVSARYPRLFRRINLRDASFGEQSCVGHLLIECGTHGNTLTEARNTAKLFGEELARVLYHASEK